MDRNRNGARLMFKEMSSRYDVLFIVSGKMFASTPPILNFSVRISVRFKIRVKLGSGLSYR